MTPKLSELAAVVAGLKPVIAIMEEYKAKGTGQTLRAFDNAAANWVYENAAELVTLLESIAGDSCGGR